MRVHELIDILGDYPADLEVMLALVAPSDPANPDITVDHYPVEGVLEWNGTRGQEDVVWLIAGESDDVEELLDALEALGDLDGADDDGDDPDDDGERSRTD